MKVKVKFLILVVVLLLSAQLSLAKTQTIVLNKGQSTAITGINITLLDYAKKYKKALVCVNDEKTIISDDKRVNGVYFEISSFRSDGVKFVLDADCEDCIESDNSKCFSKKSNDLDLDNDEKENESESQEESEIGDETSNIEANNIEIKAESEKQYQGILQRLVDWVASIFS